MGGRGGHVTWKRGALVGKPTPGEGLRHSAEGVPAMVGATPLRAEVLLLIECGLRAPGGALAAERLGVYGCRFVWHAYSGTRLRKRGGSERELSSLAAERPAV